MEIRHYRWLQDEGIIKYKFVEIRILCLYLLMSSKTLDKSLTMDIEYVDILTEENLSSFQTVSMNLIYWSVR